MNARVNLMFKSITKQEAGEFLDSEGNKRQYASKYVAKFDEIDKETGNVNERTLKFDENNTSLATALMSIKPYQFVDCELDFGFMKNGYCVPKLLNVDISKAVKK